MQVAGAVHSNSFARAHSTGHAAWCHHQAFTALHEAQAWNKCFLGKHQCTIVERDGAYDAPPGAPPPFCACSIICCIACIARTHLCTLSGSTEQRRLL